MGKLIVIEGLDGSGKATQADILSRALQETGVPVRKVSFPNYGSPASAPVKMYLNGEFGANPEDVNAYAASAFYAVDRYAGWKTGWKEFYENGGVVVADRYATSNAIHQCVKLPPSQRKAFLQWMEDFEYAKLQIPKPDLVLYLDVPPQISQKLMAKRYNNDDNKKDIHERNIEYLEHCREVALWCAEVEGWHIVACEGANPQENMLRLVEDIAKEILCKAKEIL